MQHTFAWLTRTWNRLDPLRQAALPAWLAGQAGFSLWGAWIWSQRLMPDTAGEYYRGLAPVLEGWQGALLGVWQRWDSIYYQMLTEQFYTSAKVSVFFPAYPVLGDKMVFLTGLPAQAALLVVSLLATLFSLVLLHRIARDLFLADPGLAGLALERVVLSPTAFFYLGFTRSRWRCCGCCWPTARRSAGAGWWPAWPGCWPG